jgi:hypothetical protein
MIRRNLELAVVALTSGFVGAVVPTIINTSVSAQSSRALTGDRLTLTDGRGTPRVVLGFSGGKQQFTIFDLNDRNGRQRVSFSIGPEGPPTIELKDHSGNIVQNPIRRPSQQGAGGATMTFADVRRGLTGTYARNSKEESIQGLRPPGNPTAGNVRAFLEAHKLALLGSIQRRFTEADVRKFLDAENSSCASNVYCEMAFRQQAIDLLITGLP